MNWHSMQNLVEKLECAMEMDLDPTRRFFDALSLVIRAPAFNEGKTQDAKPSKVVDADASRCRKALKWSDEKEEAIDR